MKPILIFVIAFVVATVAGTGARVMTAKPPAGVHPDSANVEAHADSTRTTDSTAAHATSRVDSATVASAQPEQAAPAAPRAAAAASGRDSTHSEPAAPPADTASERRLAKVFTAMEPKQAAKVLQHMSDGDVQIILGYVGPRQAASIMAELPPERVAKLSKLAMSGGHSK